MPLLALVMLFLIVALVYASVGFGGGSSYNALLVLSGTDFRLIPSIALSCNILVVSGGVYHFHRAGHFEFRDLLPYVALSVPMAWVGGSMEVQESTFVGLLGLMLLITAVQMSRNSIRTGPGRASLQVNPWVIGLPLGGLIGLLAGIVGIGGGVFLAPLLYLTGWGQPRRISAMASGFILVNSVAGLGGQLMKQGSASVLEGWVSSWPLFLAVLVGGQVGSRIGSKALPEKWIRRLTSLLVLYVSLRLLAKWSSITGLW